MRSTPIGALVVDLGGVAARFRPDRRLTALASATGLDERVIHERLFASGFDARCETGELTSEETMSAALAALDEMIAADVLTELWALAFEPIDEVLDHVRSATARCVLLTNNGPLLGACLAGPLRALAAAFDDVVCSWQLRAVKPDPRAFERAADLLRMRPEQLVLLDDSVVNVEAALLLGWHAVVVGDVRDVEDAIRQYSA